MSINKNPELIYGDRHVDARGVLSFFNTLNLEPIKRFYSIQSELNVVRAWQGHKKEQKWFYVVQGEFKIVLIKPDDWLRPSNDLGFEEFIINEKDVQCLHIPGGYASGFVANAPNSKIIVYSDFNLEESIQDSVRFDENLWYKW